MTAAVRFIAAGRVGGPDGELLHLDRAPAWSGGTVVHAVLADGRWVGWVGDGREWRGSRHGARKWWACWREAGDTSARWNTELVHTSRRAALTALIARIEA